MNPDSQQSGDDMSFADWLGVWASGRAVISGMPGISNAAALVAPPTRAYCQQELPCKTISFLKPRRVAASSAWPLPRPANIYLLLPPGYNPKARRRYPVFYLLHGTSGTASDWTVKGTTTEWSVTLPANTKGRLEVMDTDVPRWKLEGVALSTSPLAKKVDGGFELAAGSYRFAVEGSGNGK